jgi:hypothetical protein
MSLTPWQLSASDVARVGHREPFSDTLRVVLHHAPPDVGTMSVLQMRARSRRRAIGSSACVVDPLTLLDHTQRVAAKSIWKRDANEVLDPFARSYLRWLERHWWAPIAAAIPAVIGIALWAFAR